MLLDLGETVELFFLTKPNTRATAASAKAGQKKQMFGLDPAKIKDVDVVMQENHW